MRSENGTLLLDDCWFGILPACVSLAHPTCGQEVTCVDHLAKGLVYELAMQVERRPKNSRAQQSSAGRGNWTPEAACRVVLTALIAAGTIV